MTETNVPRPTRYCHACGTPIDATAEICPKCGARQASAIPADASDKKILPAALLCGFLGYFGAHRFYVGKIGTAILQIVTLGGLGIWVLVDFVLIIVGSFRDSRGKKLVQWT